MVSNKVAGFYPGMRFRGRGASQVEKLCDLMCVSALRIGLEASLVRGDSGLDLKVVRGVETLAEG